MITIKREPAVDDQEGNQVSNQASDQVSDQVANQVTHQVNTLKQRLTKAQKNIANFCSIPRTAQEILSRMGLSQHSVNRKRHIQSLVEMGVLEMTNPDNPTDPNQKYRKKR